MRLNPWGSAISASFFYTVSAIATTPAPLYEQVQVPQCLAQKMSAAYSVLAQNKAFKIINLPSSDIDQLSLLAQRTQCGHFVNVTHAIQKMNLPELKNAAQRLLQSRQVPRTLALNSATYEIKHQEQISAALEEVVADNIWDTLTHLTAFENRCATKSTGLDTALWLKAQVDHLVDTSGRKDSSTFFVNTGWYKQPSLVTVIGKDIKAPAVILGAHMDTLDGHMPGAGDDGSGSSGLMEATRVLLNTKATLKHPVYFIWYAAEERGLVGSQYVVEYFQKKELPVKAVIQFDMTGYRVTADDPTMWIYTDYTDQGLNRFIAQLIETYIHVPVDYSRCGYGCSDHASWTARGIPAAFPCESDFARHNPYIHSPQDTMALMNLEHMTHFCKLAIAFALELAL